MKHWRTTELIAGVTASELAQRTGRSEDAARSAAARHGLDLAPKRRGWPDSVKRRAFELRQRGESIPRVSAAVGVPMRTVQSWLYESQEQAA